MDKQNYAEKLPWSQIHHYGVALTDLKYSFGQNELCRDEGINSFPTEFILTEWKLDVWNRHLLTHWNIYPDQNKIIKI